MRTVGVNAGPRGALAVTSLIGIISCTPAIPAFAQPEAIRMRNHSISLYLERCLEVASDQDHRSAMDDWHEMLAAGHSPEYLTRIAIRLPADCDYGTFRDAVVAVETAAGSSDGGVLGLSEQDFENPDDVPWREDFLDTTRRRHFGVAMTLGAASVLATGLPFGVSSATGIEGETHGMGLYFAGMEMGVIVSNAACHFGIAMLSRRFLIDEFSWYDNPSKLASRWTARGKSLLLPGIVGSILVYSLYLLPDLRDDPWARMGVYPGIGALAIPMTVLVSVGIATLMYADEVAKTANPTVSTIARSKPELRFYFAPPLQISCVW